MTARLSDTRLLAVSGMVREGAVAADIGTDHGYLICHLVEEGISPRGYACDIAKGPLGKAAEWIRKRGLEDCVRPVLTDGLSGLPMGEIDDIVIAGMGGELISKILDCEAARDKRLHFILQPMSKAERLRKALYRIGFEIEKERGVESGGFIYTVMSVYYTGKARSVDEFFARTGRLFEDSKAGSIALLRETYRRLIAAADGIAGSGRDDSRERELREVAAQIERWLEQGGVDR